MRRIVFWGAKVGLSEYPKAISLIPTSKAGVFPLLAMATAICPFVVREYMLVWACDRLARSTKHLLQTIDELNGMGIQFLSQREAIDTEGPLGRRSSSS